MRVCPFFSTTLLVWSREKTSLDDWSLKQKQVMDSNLHFGPGYQICTRLAITKPVVSSR